MTKDEALKMALEALENLECLAETAMEDAGEYDTEEHLKDTRAVISVLRQPIKQSEIEMVMLSLDDALNKSIDQFPDATKMIEPSMGLIESEWAGLEEPPNSTTDVVEPVAWIDKNKITWIQKYGDEADVLAGVSKHQESEFDVPLYTAPPSKPQDVDVGIDVTEFGTQLVVRRGNEVIKSEFYHAPKREWVGLTDEEIRDIHWSKPMDEYSFARAIEAKLKEKNSE